LHTLYSYVPKTVAFLLFVAFTQHAMAKNYALLVGVSQYPNLAAKFQLEGPANDMRLMRNVLQKKGFATEHISILADGVVGSVKLPTRRNILATLDKLTKKVTKADFVYLHFSGHGSQQPAKEKSLDEPDGRDEIFLPRDVGKWDDRIGAVKNAIVDNEIKHHLTQLRQNSGFVWIVFDSCHSGTMTRALPVAQDRGVTLDDLGIPTDKLKANPMLNLGVSRSFSRQRQETTLGPIETDDAKQSPLVAFYAAQTVETTPEMMLPVGQPEQNVYGLFTYTIAEVLENYPNMTYRQAAQLILNRYATHNVSKKLTPLFEGSLDTLVFKKTPYNIPQQWPIKSVRKKKFKIEAGQLHQLGKGSIFAVVPDPASDDILGYLKITRAKTFKSYLKSIPYNDKSILRNRPQGAYARLVAPKMDFVLKVALPPSPKEKGDEKENRARQVLKDLATKKQNTGIQIRWIAANHPSAYLRLLLKSDKLWLLPADAELIESGPNRTYSILMDKTEKQLCDALMDSLKRIAKVRNLLRLSQLMAGKKASLKNDRLKTRIRIHRQGDELQPFENIDKIPTLVNEDDFTISMENTGKTAVDVTILYIDSRYGINAMYPSIKEIDPTLPAEFESNRIEAKGFFEIGTRLCLGEWEINDDEEYECVIDNIAKMGREYLVVIAVQAKPLTMESKFSFLSQKPLELDREQHWTEEQLSLHGCFSEAVFGGNPKRAMIGKKSLSQITMQMFSWQTSK